MEWKHVIVVLIAACLAAVGSVTGRCSTELNLVAAGIVGGVFGLSQSRHLMSRSTDRTPGS